jgi:hypothetical protein
MLQESVTSFGDYCFSGCVHSHQSCYQNR